jgi:hypothetical protein
MIFGLMDQPGTLAITCIIALLGVSWALIEGNLCFGSCTCDIVKVMAFALWSFGACGLAAWTIHACTHHLMLTDQTRIPETLYEAITMGPWTPKRIIGAFVVPFYWTHALHHHPDPRVNDGLAGRLSEYVATGIAGGGFTIPVALMAPAVLHLGSAIVFFVFYVTVHLVNFHRKWSDIHTYHHSDPDSNLSPNFCDLLFGTTDHVEDVWHQIPNVFVGCVIAVLILSWRSGISPFKRIRGIHNNIQRIYVTSTSL